MSNCIVAANWGPWIDTVKGNPSTQTYVYHHVSLGYCGVAELSTVVCSFYAKDDTELANLRSQISTNPSSGSLTNHINCPPPGSQAMGASRQNEG